VNLFWLANLRALVRQPGQLAMALAGISLGVAVVLAVDLANSSAMRAFELSEQAVSGDATHRIVSAGAGIDEGFYTRLRIEHGFRDSAPRLSGSVRTAGGRTLQVVGIDPMAAPALAVAGGAADRGLDAGGLIAGGATGLVTRETAAALGVEPGDILEVRAGGRAMDLEVLDVLDSGGAVLRGLRNVLIVDIATAQVLLDQAGRLTAIDLRLTGAETRRLQALLPASLDLRGSEARTNAMAQMTRAFRFNLSALGLLSLLVGGFLIYSTMTLFVLGRRESLAVWRTLGIRRGQVLGQTLAEAGLLAVAGCVVGAAAGVALSQILLELVTRTINDLYFNLQVGAVSLSPRALARACALGLAAPVLAALPPALEASRVQPRLALARSQAELAAGRLRRTGLWLAGLMAMLALATLVYSGRSVFAGFAGLFFVIAGFALLVPAALRVLARWGAPALSRTFGWMGLWAARNVLASMSRVQVAATAMTVALAATIGVSVMIHSFRLTVEHWLENYLRADIYISHPGDGGTIAARLPERIQGWSEVVVVNTGLWRTLPTAGEPSRLFVLDVGARGFRNFQLLNRGSEAAWPAFSGGDAVIVSEAYAYHRGLDPGDMLTLPTPLGDRDFEVAALYYDYGSDRGTVVMHRDTYLRYWDDTRIESLAVYLAPGTDGAGVIRALERGPLRDTGLVARSNRRIKDISMQIFDRTFTVTEVLRLLAIVVAGIGILSALVAIQLDRTRELAVLRASGLTRGGLSRLMMTEGGVIGFLSGLLSLPLGVLLAAVLVHVINKRSFGWSMQFSVPWDQVPVTLALGLAAGMMAAVYPAWRMNRRPLVSNLRYE